MIMVDISRPMKRFGGLKAIERRMKMKSRKLNKSVANYCPRGIKGIFRYIKFAYQRIRYGWCDGDTWDIDIWMCTVISGMLRHLAQKTNSYPSLYEYEEWQTILEDLADSLENLMLDPTDKNKYTEDYIQKRRGQYKQLWLEEEKRLYEERDKEKKKVFNMLCEHFYELWD